MNSKAAKLVGNEARSKVSNRYALVHGTGASATHEDCITDDHAQLLILATRCFSDVAQSESVTVRYEGRLCLNYDCRIEMFGMLQLPSFSVSIRFIAFSTLYLFMHLGCSPVPTRTVHPETKVSISIGTCRKGRKSPPSGYLYS